MCGTRSFYSKGWIIKLKCITESIKNAWLTISFWGKHDKCHSPHRMLRISKPFMLSKSFHLKVSLPFGVALHTKDEDNAPSKASIRSCSQCSAGGGLFSKALMIPRLTVFILEICRIFPAETSPLHVQGWQSTFLRVDHPHTRIFYGIWAQRDERPEDRWARVTQLLWKTLTQTPDDSSDSKEDGSFCCMEAFSSTRAHMS